MPPNISQPKDFFSWNREKNNRNKGSFSYPYPDKRLKYRLLHRFAAILFSSHLKVTQRLAIYKRQKWACSDARRPYVFDGRRLRPTIDTTERPLF